MRISSVFRVRNLLIAVGALLLAGGLILAVNLVRANRLRGEHDQRLSEFSDIYRREVEKQLDKLATIIEPVSNKVPIQAAWLAQDRDALLEATLPTYRDLDARFSTTHFYFHDRRGFNFLRVHEPLRCGDRIDRWTLQKAMQDNCPAGGVELGPLGTLTIRYVEPWIIDQQLVGYLEVGLEVGHVAAGLREKLGTDIVLTVRKDLLERKDWERGQRLLGRDPQWNSSTYAVVVTHTLDQLPDAIVNVLNHDRSRYCGPAFSIRDGTHSWMAGFVPLHDARNRHVGDILVLLDSQSS